MTSSRSNRRIRRAPENQGGGDQDDDEEIVELIEQQRKETWPRPLAQFIRTQCSRRACASARLRPLSDGSGRSERVHQSISNGHSCRARRAPWDFGLLAPRMNNPARWPSDGLLYTVWMPPLPNSNGHEELLP